MPEMRFQVSWPDGTREAFYSPSTIVSTYLIAGDSHALADFLALGRTALSAASERVRQIYGMPCSRALGELARLEAKGRCFAQTADARVTIDWIAAIDTVED